MSHGILPFIQFDGITFRVEADHASGVYPDWVWQPVINVRHIPGSNTAVVQHMGCPPATITLSLLFDDPRDFYQIQRRQGLTGRLTLLANFTSAVGVVEHRLGQDYEHFDGVTLLGITTPQTSIGQYGRDKECKATFMRPMDPLTGLAVTS